MTIQNTALPNAVQPGSVKQSPLTGYEIVDVNAGPIWAQSTVAGVADTALVDNAVTAAGTNQATAYVIVAQQTNITTASSGTGVVLNAATKPGMRRTIFNNGAHTVAVYANGSDTVDGIAGSTGTTLGAGESAVFTCNALTSWISAAYAGTSSGGGAVTEITFDGATSGQTILEASPVASGTLTLPNPPTTDTLAALGLAQTWTGVQTFGNGKLVLAGSSSGGMTVEAPAAASTYVITYPAATDTLAGVAATQTLTNKTLTTPIIGSGGATFNGTSGTTTLAASATAAGALTLPAITGTVASTTGSDLYLPDVYRSASTTSLTNATPGAINGMSSMPVVVGTYKIQARLPNTANGTSGIAISFVLTTAVLGAISTTAKNFEAAAIQTQYNATATSGTNLFASTTASLEIAIDGTFTVTTGGTISLDACLNTGSTSAVIQAGAYCEITRIA